MPYRLSLATPFASVAVLIAMAVPAPAQSGKAEGDGLPLERGFYVTAGTPCGRAANATLLLMRRDGINWSREGCAFRKIEKVGPTSYRVRQSCDFGGGPPQVVTVVYEIPNRTSFTAKSDDGWSYAGQFCAQKSLPEPWRSNDIRDLVK